jgi:hypothetical protein
MNTTTTPGLPSADDATLRQAAAIPCHQEALVELGASPRGILLIQSCPALAVMLVHAGARVPREARRLYFQKMAALPWRELLAKLGLPARQQTLQILRKLPPEHCHVHTVRKLRQVLCQRSHPWRHILPSLPRLTRDAVSVLQLDASLVSAELLQVSTESDSDVETVYWLIVSVRTLLLQSGHVGPWPYAGVGLERLKLLEGELFARLNPDPTAFPSPPFASRPGEIEPIQDLFALAREAEEQGNHAFVVLLPEILIGEAYVYAVLRPTRTTLALRRTNAFDEWKIHELRGPRNTAPAPNTSAAVEAWLSAAKRIVPEN